MMIHPSELYKYKPIASETDLERVLQIINNHEIYIPSYHQLNDPLESAGAYISLAVAGAGNEAAMGEIGTIVDGYLSRYRILSFSSVPDSPLMWAHYANDYHGCCLIFRARKTFNEVLPVVYTDIQMLIHEDDFRSDKYDIDDAVHDSFLFKKKDWAYENEWRLIQKEKPGYLTYSSDELVGVLLGHKLEEDRAEQIIQSCRSHGIPYLKTKPAPRFSKIKFIPCCSRNDFKGCVWDAIDQDVRESTTLSKETKDLYRNMNSLI